MSTTHWKVSEGEYAREWADFLLKTVEAPAGGVGLASDPVAVPDDGALREEAWRDRLWFGTLTFRDVLYAGQTEPHEPGTQRRHKAASGFGHRAGYGGSGGGHSIVVEERGERFGRWHLHCLANVSAPVMEAALAWWRREHGHVKVSEVAAPQHAAAYVAKYMAKYPDFRFWVEGK